MNVGAKMKSRIVGLALLIILGLTSAHPLAAQTNPTAELLGRINTVRLTQGLAPYALNSALTAAAQRHSQDMAATGKVDHIGSDNSSYRERILAAGYGQWSIGPVVNESLYGGTGGAGIVFDWWMSVDTHRNQILSRRYREIGLAAVTGANGWTYWTVVFGAQPNVLPIFVNDGATSVDDPDVLITLTNEDAVPAGEGMSTMGVALQVRLAHDEQFSGADWQPWQPRLPFQLLLQGGEQRVYVQYRDAQGRTALASTAITLTNVPVTPSPTPPPTDTPTPPATLTPAPTATASPSLSLSPSPTTPTPHPTDTPAPTSTPALSLSPTPTATRTPRPRVNACPPPTPTTHFISLNDGAPPPGLTTVWLILQSLVVILGIGILIHRTRKA